MVGPDVEGDNCQNAEPIVPGDEDPYVARRSLRIVSERVDKYLSGGVGEHQSINPGGRDHEVKLSTVELVLYQGLESVEELTQPVNPCEYRRDRVDVDEKPSKHELE